MPWVDDRKNSRIQWGRHCNGDKNPDHDAIKLGAVLRIADACELMAKNHAALIAERDRYEHWYKEARADNERLSRRINALRGVINRMKRAATRTEGKE